MSQMKSKHWRKDGNEINPKLLSFMSAVTNKDMENGESLVGLVSTFNKLLGFLEDTEAWDLIELYWVSKNHDDLSEAERIQNDVVAMRNEAEGCALKIFKIVSALKAKEDELRGDAE